MSTTTSTATRSRSSGSDKMAECMIRPGVAVSQKTSRKIERFPLLGAQERARLLVEVKEDAKVYFEKDRADILTSLPDAIRRNFFQVGYARWENEYLPALALNPFKVAPGPNRNYWLKRYKVRRRSNTLDKFGHFVFWYGENNETYSLIPRDGFVPYSVSNGKKFDHLYNTIQKLLRNGLPLTPNQQKHMQARQEMLEDSQMTKQQIGRAFSDYQDSDEVYESLTEKDLIEYSVKLSHDAHGNPSSVFNKKRKRGGEPKCSSPFRGVLADGSQDGEMPYGPPDDSLANDSIFVVSPEASIQILETPVNTDIAANRQGLEMDSKNPRCSAVTAEKDNGRFDYYIQRIQNLRSLNQTLWSEYVALESIVGVDQLSGREGFQRPPHVRLVARVSGDYFQEVAKYLEALEQNNKQLQTANSRLREITDIEY